jgi:hypothetical protein
LTSPRCRRKTNAKVLPFPNNLYAQWRLESGAVPLLHERSESPPERLLQAIWQHQRLRRDQLESLDGETIRVLHPGFLNRGGGPDFRGAVIQIGAAPPRAGDVEVDVQAGGWRAHGHDRNPAFLNVILHVIWEGERSGPPVPPASLGSLRSHPGKSSAMLRKPAAALAIGNKLDAPLGELSLWVDSEAVDDLPDHLRGRCGPGLRKLSAENRSRMMCEAAQLRFRSKAEQMQARATRVGWEQALWEGLFRALGYKQNIWPMHCLAEQRGRWLPARVSTLGLQARLLGIGGLLPVELTRIRASADDYVRRIWDHWWREREEFQDCLLPAAFWRFYGQRPANHPQRRLALATHWLTSGNFLAGIERWCAAAVPDRKLAVSLAEVLRVERDDFWAWHWTLRSPRLKKPQPLLGPARVTDLAVNVILPWLWIRAAEGKNPDLQRAIEHRFNVWPPAEDNAVLRHARLRLLDGAPRRVLRSAAEQQGLIQIARDFCDHSNAICDHCRFPELVGELARSQPV